MKLIKGNLKEDRSRDVFWQNSFVEDEQGKLLCKIIVSASQEFLALTLKREMKDVNIDEEMKKWFDEKTDKKYLKLSSVKIQEDVEAVFDIYPQTEGMFNFTKSLIE